MAKPDGRVEKGQSLKRAISATRWNDLCDAADIVHGRRGGVTGGETAKRTHALGKTSAQWTKGSSQQISVYAGQQGSEVQTSDVILAWNSFADIESGKWVMLGRAGNRWYVISAECD